MPNPSSFFYWVWHKNPVRVIKLVVRALLPGRIPKGIWVSQDIAGGELYDFRQKIVTLPMSAINWLKQQKLEFIKDEIFALTIAGAFRQGRGSPIYYNGKDISDQQRSDLYKFIKNILNGYEENYKYKVSDEQHIQDIENLQAKINKNYSSILRLHFGRTQKLFNLYLKYLWVLDLIPEPPHCPFDRIIIEKLKAKVPDWTKPNFEEKHYIELLNIAKDIVAKEGLSIAEWELKTFNNRYPAGQIVSEPIAQT